MVAYSLQNQINNLEMDVKIQKSNIAKLQSFADSLPEGERKEFYLWKIKAEWEHVADLEQEISDLERRLHFATSSYV